MSIEDGIRNFVKKNPKYNIYENLQSIWMTMVLKMLISRWRGYPMTL